MLLQTKLLCAGEFSDICTDIFDISLQQAVFPSCLETTTIIPEQKKSTLSGFNNWCADYNLNKEVTEITWIFSRAGMHGRQVCITRLFGESTASSFLDHDVTAVNLDLTEQTPEPQAPAQSRKSSERHMTPKLIQVMGALWGQIHFWLCHQRQPKKVRSSHQLWSSSGRRWREAVRPWNY